MLGEIDGRNAIRTHGRRREIDYDHAMQITEVVRGEDLLKSTARQLLIYRAMGLQPPQFYHCNLLRDESGTRLAKRHDALSLRHLRESGLTAHEVKRQAFKH